MSNIPTHPGTATPEPILPDEKDDAIGRPDERGTEAGNDVLPPPDGDDEVVGTPDPLQPDVAPDAGMPRPM